MGIILTRYELQANFITLLAILFEKAIVEFVAVLTTTTTIEYTCVKFQEYKIIIRVNMI